MVIFRYFYQRIKWFNSLRVHGISRSLPSAMIYLMNKNIRNNFSLIKHIIVIQCIAMKGNFGAQICFELPIKFQYGILDNFC